MTRTLDVALALSLACGCRAEPPSPPRAGLEARIALDRSEARVGDRLGVTVEIDVPPGFEVQAPFLPSSATFVTEAIDSPSSPVEQRRVLLWTVRPRQVGDLRLPELSVPFTTPGGELQQLVLAGLPLRVRSVRPELPARDATFDIRSAPPLAPDTGMRRWPWLLGLALAAAASVAIRRWRAGAVDARQLARGSLAALAAARGTQPREAAQLGALALRSFAARRWRLELDARHAGELGEPIDASLCAALVALERARFAREPLASEVTASLDSAVAYLSDVARR